MKPDSTKSGHGNKKGHALLRCGLVLWCVGKFWAFGTRRKALDPGFRRDDDFEFRSFYKLISDARAAVFGQLWYGEWMPASLPNVITCM